MVRFSLFGIPVVIQPWFWVSLAIIGGALDAASSGAFLVVSLFVLAGGISILVHELGHALTIRAFGAPSAITLHAFGGFATHPPGVFGRGREFIVSGAGPALQILLGVAAWLVLAHLKLPTLPAVVFVENLRDVSIFWAVLNLVPVVPLDGGQMLSAMLGRDRRAVVLRISMITAGVIAVAVFVMFRSVLFPVFLAMFAWQNYQELRNFR
jgi:Zn-dependent protease